MDDSGHKLATAAYDLLERLGRETPTTEHAAQLTAACEAQFPGSRWKVLLQHEELAADATYTLVIRHGKPAATLTLSKSAASNLPWPLRGIQRWRHQELLRVNGCPMELHQAIGCVEFLWRERSITQRLVDVLLIQREADTRGIAVPDAELQDTVDAFRRGQGLMTVEETNRWMSARGMTLKMLEEYARDQAVVDRLKRSIVTPALAARRFEERPADFARLTIGWCTVVEPDALAELTRTFRETRGNYNSTVSHGLELGMIRRCTLDSYFVGDEPRELVETATLVAPGCLVPWTGTVDNLRVLAVLLRREGPRFDEPTRRRIESLLFSEWLAAERSKARIEWHWGKAQS